MKTIVGVKIDTEMPAHTCRPRYCINPFKCHRGLHFTERGRGAYLEAKV